MNKFRSIIEEICHEENIKYKYISNDFITVLEKDGKYKYIYNNLLDLNSQVAGIVVDDKYAMYEILKYHHIPVIEYNLVWDQGNIKNEEEIKNKISFIKDYYVKNNHNIVLKPNRGYAGINVFNIKNIDDIETCFRKLLNYTNSIVLSPFYKIKNEHRIIILNNEIRLMYTKNRRNNWQFNLSKGSYVTKINNEKLKQDLINLSLKTYKYLNSTFVSIDIIEDYNNNLYVLEVNSSVSTSKYLEQIPSDYNLVKEIYRDAIKLLFKI